MNHYERLGISAFATHDEIKTAFRKAAMKWHPDRNPGDKEAEEIFKNVNEAYRVLADKSLRFWYDRELVEEIDRKNRDSQNFSDDSNSFSQEETDNAYQEYSQSEGAHEFNQEQQTPSEEDKENIETDAYGYFQRKYPYHNIFSHNLVISYSDSITGGEFRFPFLIPEKGNIFVSIKVPPHTEDGSLLEIRLTKKDILIVSLSIEENATQHLDIHTEHEIDVFSALAGCDIVVETTMGEVNVRVPPMTQNKDIIVIYGKGYKKEIFQGDMYLKILVRYPSSLTDRQSELLSELANIQQTKDNTLFSRFKRTFFGKK